MVAMASCARQYLPWYGVLQWSWLFADCAAITGMSVTVGSDFSCSGYDDGTADLTEQLRSVPCATLPSDATELKICCMGEVT